MQHTKATTPFFASAAVGRGIKRRTITWIALCASIAIGGCASPGSSSPEDQVTKRASERWKYMLAKDMDRTYSYTTPGFRALVSVEAYRGRFGAAAIWLGAEVVRVECSEPAKCKAVVRVDFRPTLGSANNKISTHVDETWLLENNQWWIFQDIKG